MKVGLKKFRIVIRKITNIYQNIWSIKGFWIILNLWSRRRIRKNWNRNLILILKKIFSGCKKIFKEIRKLNRNNKIFWIRQYLLINILWGKKNWSLNLHKLIIITIIIIQVNNFVVKEILMLVIFILILIILIKLWGSDTKINSGWIMWF